MPLNRIAGILDAMQKQTDDLPKAKKQKSEFALRFINHMKAKGFTAKTLADAVNATGTLEEPAEDFQIRNFMTSSVSSLASIRNAPLLKACADVMKCSVEYLFGEDQPTTPALENPTKAHDELHAMLDTALDGPKSGFLKEALQFAFTQAILARNHL